MFVSVALPLQNEKERECEVNGDGISTCSSKNNPSPPKQQNKQEEASSTWKIPKNIGQLSKRAANKAQRGIGTRIVSNFLKDEKLLQDLADHRAWFGCYENTRGKNTHWLDANEAPNNIFEYLATEIWREQPLLKELQRNRNFAGYEIWCNILTPEGPLDWHVDKDQVAHKESYGKNISLPFYGSVFYGYPHEFEGGYLEMTKCDQDTFPKTDDIDPTQVERIDAEYNRLVVFNASKFHRVAPITKGTRVTLAVNIWDKRPRIAEQ